MNSFTCASQASSLCEEVAYSLGDAPAGWQNGICGPCCAKAGLPAKTRAETTWYCTSCGQKVESAKGHAEGDACLFFANPSPVTDWLRPL